MSSNPKIIFFGSFGFAVPTLEALKNEGYDIVAVITNPDKPSGRKKILTPPPVKIRAQGLGFRVLQPINLKDPKFVNDLYPTPSTLPPDIGIVVGYGKIIPPEIFNLPQHGTIVIHPSLLPKYRGPSPVQTAILNGDVDTGVTIMKIDAEMDHGPIVANHKLQITNYKSAEETHEALFELGTDLLIKILPDYLAGNIKPQPQDHSQATFTHKFKIEDGEIKSADTAEYAYNKIRALNPEPGAYIWFEKGSAKGGSAFGGKKIRLKILEAELKDGHLEFAMVQPEGGKPMSFKEFLAGHPQFKNNLLE